jgi:hypothetical protein
MIVSLYAFLPKKKKTKVHPTPTTWNGTGL